MKKLQTSSDWCIERFDCKKLCFKDMLRDEHARSKACVNRLGVLKELGNSYLKTQKLKYNGYF